MRKVKAFSMCALIASGAVALAVALAIGCATTGEIWGPVTDGRVGGRRGTP